MSYDVTVSNLLSFIIISSMFSHKFRFPVIFNTKLSIREGSKDDRVGGGPRR